MLRERIYQLYDKAVDHMNKLREIVKFLNETMYIASKLGSEGCSRRIAVALRKVGECMSVLIEVRNCLDLWLKGYEHGIYDDKE